MKKLISWLGAFVIFSSSTALVVSCRPTGTTDINPVDFSSIAIPQLTIRVDKNETFNIALNNSDEEGTNFCNILEKYVNDFATENNISDLTLGTDYQFDTKGIDQYNPIGEYKPITISVTAYPDNDKIYGGFNVTVNLVAKAVSISNLGIQDQNISINQSEITTFQQLVDKLDKEMIKQKIVERCSDAKIHEDYGIFVQGISLETKIQTSDAGKSFKINIQAVTPAQDNLSKLKDWSSFNLKFEFAK